jgi:hypothetical protein
MALCFGQLICKHNYNPQERHAHCPVCVSDLSNTCEPRAAPRAIVNRVSLELSILEALSSNYARKSTVLISIS